MIKDAIIQVRWLSPAHYVSCPVRCGGEHYAFTRINIWSSKHFVASLQIISSALLMLYWSYSSRIVAVPGKQLLLCPLALQTVRLTLRHSRQAIKKHVRNNHQLGSTTDAAFDKHIASALNNGEKSGEFERPKGPSGPVKLARKDSAAKSSASKPKTEKKTTATKPAVKKSSTSTATKV